MTGHRALCSLVMMPGDQLIPAEQQGSVQIKGIGSQEPPHHLLGQYQKFAVDTVAQLSANSKISR